jgi:hypothetical protein
MAWSREITHMKLATTIVPSLSLALLACASAKPRLAAPPAPGTYSASFQTDKNKSSAVLPVDAPGDSPRLRSGGIVRFISADPRNSPLDLTIQVSTDKTGSAFEDRTTLPLFKTKDGFTVVIKDLQGGIKHEHWIRFRVKDAAHNADSTYWVRYKQRWAFSGFTSPVLYKIEGNANAFGLSNFAPSVAGGARYNFDGQSETYLSLNPILTVYKSGNDAAPLDRPYSVALGLVGDISGYLQVGSTYHFKTQKWALVFGIRPEVLSHLTGQ